MHNLSLIYVEKLIVGVCEVSTLDLS